MSHTLKYVKMSNMSKVKYSQLVRDVFSFSFYCYRSGFNYLSSEKFHSIHSPYWWLRCLFWKSQDSNLIVNKYKKLLEKHILEKPKFLDSIDKFLNPIMGKSFAMYFEKL